MLRQRFDIVGMHCSGCVMAVEGAIEDLDGVKSAKASYARQSAEVEYDERVVTPDSIIAAISEAGYDAHLATR